MRNSISNTMPVVKDHYPLLNAMMNSLADVVLATDQEGIIIVCNPAAQQMLTIDDSTLLGRSICELVSLQSGKQLARLAGKVLRDNHPVSRTILLGLPCGHHIEIDLTLSLIRVPGSESCFSAVVRGQVVPPVPVEAVDASFQGRMVSANAMTEDSVLKNEKRFRSIVENSAEGIAILSVEGTPSYISPSIRTILGYEEEEAMTMNLFKATHPDDLPALSRLWARVIASPGVAIRAYPCRIMHKDGRYRIFDGTLTNFLHDDSINGIVDNFRDVTEIVETENKIRESEERYRQLFFSNPGPMWIFNPRTLKFLAVNASACKQYGYTEEEFLSLTVLDIRPPHEEEHFMNAVSCLAATGHNKAGVFEHLTRDGQVIYVDIVSHLITYEGTNAMLVLAKNITEQRKANQLLMKSYVENSTILESIGDGFFSVDKNFMVVYWNKVAEQIVGVPRSAVLGKNLFETFSEELSLKSFSEYKRSLEENVTVMFEEYYPATDAWLEVVAYPSDRGLSVYFRDITPRKKAIDEISKANEKFNTIARISNDAIYEWDIVENVIYWGEGYANLFGHKWTPGKMPVESWRDNIHPNEKTALMDFAQEAFRQRVPTIKRELKFRCADGSYKILDDKLAIIYDEDGKPLRLVGAMQDITDKRMMEVSLQNARNRQQRAITRATMDGQEKEREQIGIELHDNINQILATAGLYIEHGLSMENIPADIITQGKEMVQLATKEIRKLSHTLLPPSVGEFDLIASLKDLAAPINLSGKFQVIVDFCQFVESGLSRDHKLTIYRIVQEQLNNILKHAQCSEVLISLRRAGDDEQIELLVADNGKGFDCRQKKNGVGLRNIVSRAELLCGRVGIETSPGNGCRMTVLIPSQTTPVDDCFSIAR